MRVRLFSQNIHIRKCEGLKLGPPSLPQTQRERGERDDKHSELTDIVYILTAISGDRMNHFKIAVLVQSPSHFTRCLQSTSNLRRLMSM